MRTKLIILAAWYPLKAGDGIFIRNEINALAAAFDEVVVFNNTGDQHGDTQTMPPNVRYGGNLAFSENRTRLLKSLLSPRIFFRLVSAAFREMLSGELRGNFSTFINYSLSGIELSTEPRVRAELSDKSVTTTVYSFWGVGAGFALPWFPRMSGGLAVRLNGYDLYKEVMGYLPLRPALFGRVNRIVVGAEFGRDYLLQNYPHLDIASKIYVGRLGTVDHEFKSRPTRGAETLVVSCSRMHPVKRVDKIVDALPLVHTDGTFRWIHFGGGELEDEIRHRARNISDDIRVELRGQTDNADILEFYQNNRVDVFVNVSSSEGVPVSVMEAMSFGIPILATNVGGTGEIVGPDLGSGELLSPEFSNEELADGLTKILAAPDGQYDSRAAWERLCNGNTNSKALAAELLSLTDK